MTAPAGSVVGAATSFSPSAFTGLDVCHREYSSGHGTLEMMVRYLHLAAPYSRIIALRSAIALDEVERNWMVYRLVRQLMYFLRLKVRGGGGAEGRARCLHVLMLG